MISSSRSGFHASAVYESETKTCFTLRLPLPLMVRLLPSLPPCLASSLPKPTAPAFSSSLRPPTMSSSTPVLAATASVEASRPRKLPVLLFDVMDTIVRDPFYHHIPSFFQMSMKELLESKHPTAWSEFEMGMINEGITCPIRFPRSDHAVIASHHLQDSLCVPSQGRKGIPTVAHITAGAIVAVALLIQSAAERSRVGW